MHDGNYRNTAAFGPLARQTRMLRIACLLALAACGQNLGERCQLTSDCNPGLICTLTSGGDCRTGGVCTTFAGGYCGADDACPAGFHCVTGDPCPNDSKRLCMEDVDLAVPFDFSEPSDGGIDD
jgi:hypothetical protein